jgi:RNA 2',3'-cyclic 3'-phosphodiesterase
LSDARLRLFVALELPAETRAALADWVQIALELNADARGAADHPSVRPLPPDSLHVTLCFLGWCDADQVSQIAAACDEVSAERPAELRAAEALWLPRRRPRVLAVALDDLDERLARVQEALAGRLQAGGWYVPEQRRFLAHVTVARVQRARAPEHAARGPGRNQMRRGAGSPRKQLQAPPPLSVVGDRVTLFRSMLHPSGARYEALHSVTLGG